MSTVPGSTPLIITGCDCLLFMISSHSGLIETATRKYIEFPAKFICGLHF